MQVISEYQIESNKLNTRVLNLESSNRLLEAQFKEADLSFKVLSSQIRGLDEKNKTAVNEIDKIKKKDQDVTTLLDTKLPPDIQRVLDTATD